MLPYPQLVVYIKKDISLFPFVLQANNGNVEIGSEGILDTAIDTMTVQLLSTKRHFEELQEYRAPSVDN